MTDDKVDFMRAFFDDLDARVAYLPTLHTSGHGNEAMLLCCCYIDGLASYLFPQDEGSHRNFVRAIREYGDAEWLARLHPRQLRESLEKMDGARARQAADAVRRIPVAAPLELPTEQEFLAWLPQDTEPALVAWLTPQLWRGTLASIAYTRLRVPAVHQLGAPGGIEFDDSRIDGRRVPVIDFRLLHGIVERISTSVRELSIRTAKWFGRD